MCQRAVGTPSLSINSVCHCSTKRRRRENHHRLALALLLLQEGLLPGGQWPSRGSCPGLPRLRGESGQTRIPEMLQALSYKPPLPRLERKAFTVQRRFDECRRRYVVLISPLIETSCRRLRRTISRQTALGRVLRHSREIRTPSRSSRPHLENRPTKGISVMFTPSIAGFIHRPDEPDLLPVS